MKILLAGVVALALLAGCSKPREAEARSTAVAPAPAAPVPVASPPNSASSTAATPVAQPSPPPPPTVPSGNLHGFAPDEVVSVTFKEINEKGYPIVIMKNLTGRNIETIRGSFRLVDADGSYLHGAGLTIAVPGQLFILAGGQTENSPFGLIRKPEAMQRLATAPDELSFAFQAQDVTFIEVPPE